MVLLVAAPQASHSSAPAWDERASVQSEGMHVEFSHVAQRASLTIIVSKILLIHKHLRVSALSAFSKGGVAEVEVSF
jgi:hypothetical protein